jgi:ZIP family zinc transporter
MATDEGRATTAPTDADWLTEAERKGYTMPVWLAAGGWGLLAGSALVVGAIVAWGVRVPPRVVAGIMAFGAGVLISALAFELVDEAERIGGLTPTVVGFLVGASAYVLANVVLARRGARHRKRSGDQQPSEQEQAGSGTAIAVGALLDGIPESVVLGVSLLGGGGVGVGVLAAVFVSNVPEGLSSAAGMKRAGRGAAYVFGVWVGIAVASGVAALVGAALLQNASEGTIAVITAAAAGAILAMLADTMIPEAFEQAHLLTGLITTFGFLIAFAIDRA